MNTKQIIAELRRSACNDRDPLTTLWDEAYVDVADFAQAWLKKLPPDAQPATTKPRRPTGAFVKGWK